MAFLTLFVASFSIVSGAISAAACAYWINQGRLWVARQMLLRRINKSNLRKVS